MNKEMKKARALTLLAALSLLLGVVVFIVLNGSVAWFSQNRTVDANGMTVAVKVPESVVQGVTVYNILGETDSGMYFEETGTVVDADAVRLPQFNILSSQNPAILMHIQLNRSLDSVNFFAETQTDYFMDAEHHLLGGDGTGGMTASGEEYQNCLTSIVAMYCPSSIDRNATYGGMGAILVSPTELGAPYTFAGRNGNTGKMDIINKELNFFTDETVTDVYLIIEYNDDLVSYVLTENAGYPEDPPEDGVKYNMDFAITLTNQ